MIRFHPNLSTALCRLGPRLLVALLALPVALPAAADEILLSMGQEISLQLAHHVTSAYNPQGSKVYFRVGEDVVSGDRILVRKGDIVPGTVGQTKKGRSFGRSGKIELVVRSLAAVDGTTVPLEGELEFKGRERTGATVGGAVALGVVGGFLVKGRSAVLEKGDFFSTYVGADRQIGPAQAPQAVETVEYLEAEARALQPTFELKIEKKKKLLPLHFRISPPAGATPPDLEKNRIEMARIAGANAAVPVRPERVVSESGGLRTEFDSWQVVCYCDPGPCEVELRGTLDDGRKWAARTAFVLDIKKKEPKK